MADLDKMARELLAQANERLGLRWASGRIRDGDMDAHEREFCNTIRAALLTAPPGWRLVPIEPTPKMVEAAREHHEGEAYLPFSLYKAMIAAAPEVK